LYKPKADTTKTQDGQRKTRGLPSLQAAENGIRVEKRKYNRSKPVNKSIISAQKKNDLPARKSKKFKNGNEKDQNEEFVYMDLGEVEELGLALEEKRQQLGSTVASPATSSDSEDLSDDSLLGILSSAEQSPQPARTGSGPVAKAMKKAKISLSKIKLSGKAATSCVEQPVSEQAVGNSLDWNLSDDSLLGLLSSAEQSPQPAADENRSEQPVVGDQAEGNSWSKLSPDWNLSDDSLRGLLSSAEQSPQPAADGNRSEQPDGDQAERNSWSKLSPNWSLSDNSLLGPSSAEQSPQPEAVTAGNSQLVISPGVTAKKNQPVIKLMDIARTSQTVEDSQSWLRFLASDSDLSGDSLLGLSSAEQSPEPVRVSEPVVKEMEITGIKQDVVTAKRSLPVIKLEDMAITSQIKNEEIPGIRVPGLDPTATNLRQLLLGKKKNKFCLLYIFLSSFGTGTGFFSLKVVLQLLPVRIWISLDPELSSAVRILNPK
jgi:hypothetical protein